VLARNFLDVLRQEGVALGKRLSAQLLRSNCRQHFQTLFSNCARLGLVLAGIDRLDLDSVAHKRLGGGHDARKELNND
jgi:hypothetical protein